MRSPVLVAGLFCWGSTLGTHEQTDESVFFPPGTNVECFETVEGALSLESRVKEALILYDKVVFQSGLSLVDIGLVACGTTILRLLRCRLVTHSGTSSTDVASQRGLLSSSGKVTYECYVH